jgi:hypothetical protein
VVSWQDANGAKKIFFGLSALLASWLETASPPVRLVCRLAIEIP